MFGWWKKLRRNRITQRPFPRPWKELLHARMWQYGQLDIPERDKLHQCVKVMVAEKFWEGCEGLQLTEAMRVTIAGHASLMLLGTNDYYFDGVRSVLIFPQAFHRKTLHGMVVGSEERSGEAWQGGPISLSWEDVRAAAQTGSDYNVVVHEFAHHLDGLDGEMGGSPIFEDAADQQAWSEVLELEFTQLSKAAARREWTVLRYYGAKNRAEFFAVASECFFQTPHRLKSGHPELFDLLFRFYRVDPAHWAA